MKRFSSRDALLMLAPVGALAAFGWLLSARKPAVMKVGPTGPFRPFVSRVQVVPATPIDVFDGYDTRVVVEFSASGSLPKWWINGFGSYYGRDSGQLTRQKGKATVSLGRAGRYSSPHLDSKSKRWICTYNLKLREVPPQSGQIRLRDTIKFENNTQKSVLKMWLDVPVRANGVTTKLPLVSRVPAVKMEQFSFDVVPPTKTLNGAKEWRANWTFLKNIPLAGAESDTDSVSPQLEIVNRDGQRRGSWTSATSGSEQGVLFGNAGSNVDHRRSFASQDYELDAMDDPALAREPLWLQGTIRCGEKWPLSIKIPIRDATGKMLLSPRTPTIPFHVVSATKVAPNPTETADGADCVVRVVLRSKAPKVNILQWAWEAEHSQHIRSASGREFWQFPTKGGKGPIGLSHSWTSDPSRVELRYRLALKSIAPKEKKLIFHADIAANRSRFVPVEVTVRP